MLIPVCRNAGNAVRAARENEGSARGHLPKQLGVFVQVFEGKGMKQCPGEEAIAFIAGILTAPATSFASIAAGN